MREAIFLDRDGVITIPSNIDGKGYAPRSLEEFRFYSGVQNSLEKIRALGFLTLIVSNQPDVANGLLPIHVLEQMNIRMLSDLALDDINNCPHNSLDHCGCRKPKPGMLISSAKKWNIELGQSWMIGDRDSDIAAGFAAGCRTIFIDRNWTEETGEFADFRCDSLERAVELISDRKRV